MRTNTERKAKQTLQWAGISTIPVPIKRVAYHLGIKIRLADLGEDCSGVLVRKGERAVIGVNWRHGSNRQRFSIAHEIGHFVLHSGETYIDKGYSVHFRAQESGSGTKREEMEANAFAAALLMPTTMVREPLHSNPLT